jgi:lipoyl(octanoyl) transferase
MGSDANETVMPRAGTTEMATRVRLLNDPAMAGVVNMARDEALLTHVGNGSSPPTLRLYEWTEPTISLGYFQRIEDCESLTENVRNLPTVRRLTGGGAILHDGELTYSLVIPADHELVGGQPTRLYRMVHDAIIACFADANIAVQVAGRSDGSGPTKGPFFCFARRHELDVVIPAYDKDSLNVGDAKVAGSAQRRTREAILQHGSIILKRNFREQPSADLAGEEITIEALRSGLPSAFAASNDLTIESGEWRPDELATALSLGPKYGQDEWTRRM